MVDAIWIPVIVTVVAYGVVYACWPKSRGDYDFSPIFGCGFFLAGTVVSLIAWLVWALAR